MKKLIVTAAGLMLAGTMVSSAFATTNVPITFNSDARARGQYFTGYELDGTVQNGELGNDTDTSEWNSRVRLKVQANTAGGAYAVARVRMADATWDGAQGQSKGSAQGSNIYTDYAYLGTPMGPVAVEAGLMPFDITTFSFYDERVQGVHVKYASDNTTVVGFYHKTDEYENDDTGKVVPYDIVNDDDKDRYGVWVNQKFDGGWGVVGSIWMSNNNQAQTVNQGVDDGVGTALEVTGTAGTVGLLADFAWYEGDLVGRSDDPLGFYVQAAMPVGAASIAVGAGMTTNGFIADGDFGPFIMLSDVSNIATGVGIGSIGRYVTMDQTELTADTNFVALVPSMKVSEQVTVTGVLAYADIDHPLVESALEASGAVNYTVVEGAVLTAEAGYLDVEGLTDPIVGAGLSLDLSF